MGVLFPISSNISGHKTSSIPISSRCLPSVHRNRHHILPRHSLRIYNLR